MALSLDEWQKRLDDDFPAGAVVRLTSPGASDGGTVFKTTGIAVVGLDGEQPRVRFWDSGVDKDYLVTLQVYEVVRVNPVKVARAETSDGQVFMFGGGLTPENVQIGWMATRRVERDTALEFAK